MSDECDHYDSQVAVQITELEVTDENEVDRYCDWCGGLPSVVLRKSTRHNLVLCNECGKVIDTLDLDGVIGDVNG